MRRPSSSLPDFIAIQSSPVSNKQFFINTFLHDSGSQPSLFGPCETTLTFSMVIFSDNKGCINHIGELSILTSEIRIFLQLINCTILGRKKEPSPKTRVS